MLFNSIQFLIFFPIVSLLFYIMPRKVRYIWLLISSYYFYMSWNPKYALLLACSTYITYVSGVLIDRYNTSQTVHKTRNKKLCVAASFVLNLAILAIFKYGNFFLYNLNLIFGRIGIETVNYHFDFLLPVGISFYTFQALSYTMDVYRGDISAERNILKYALFVSFFPQLVAGPIERSKNLLLQIQETDKVQWNSERIRDGLLLMFWGLFQKMVIADRAAILVDQVYSNYTQHGFVEISFATILFAFQIYCDFGGYSNIARGAAQVMGFSLMENFRQPYLATNIKEFWHRWHISLTSWFTDYLYIPLGGNRKGQFRKYINILIVFAVSGLWHGTSWRFIVWGGLHGIYQVCGDLKRRAQKHFTGENTKSQDQLSLSQWLRKAFTTFLLVDFAWLFFAADGLPHALRMIRQMCTHFFMARSLYVLGLDEKDLSLLLLAILLLMIVDIVHERNHSLLCLVNRQEIWFRWGIYYALILSIIIFGIYGPEYDASQFIYFQF